MNKVLLLFALLLLTTFTAFAQLHPSGITAPKITKLVNIEGRQYDGSEELSGPIRMTLHQQYMLDGATTKNEGKEEWIGSTFYDLQTNGTIANRLLAQPDCEITAVWTGHPSTTNQNFPNRGTFFQEAENCGPFGPMPADRIEPSSRTGWPNVVQLEDGTNLVINHTFAGNNAVLLVRQNADGTWSEENSLTSDADLGFLWPRAVAVGQTIHLIGATGPNDPNAPVYEATYEGLTQAILYYRSDDGGLTWAIQDYIIPGTTSEEILGYNGDTYSIAADENGNVAIGIFGLTEDVILLKSDQNGDVGSWTKRIVHDFPIEKYELGTGYTLEDIGGIDPRGPAAVFEDPTTQDSLSIGTSDGTGSVALDVNGMAHVTYSQLFIYSDESLQPGFASASLLPTGIAYWNESFEDDNANFIQAVEVGLDVNRNGAYDFADGAIYTNGFSSLVTSSNLEVTDDGELIVTYQQPNETLLSENPDGAQYYTQIFVTASSDGGQTWGCPFNIINEEFSILPQLVPRTDAVFPHTDLIEGDHLAIMYQFDDEPGLALDADENDPISTNTISEVSIRVNDFVDTSTPCEFTTNVLEVVNAETFALSIAPNPAKNITRVSYTVDTGMNMELALTTITGQQLKSANLRPNAPGTYNYDLNTTDLTAGIYLISLRTDDQVATTRLMIVK